jgi:hypothetical protein
VDALYPVCRLEDYAMRQADLEDGGSMILQNTDKLLLDYKPFIPDSTRSTRHSTRCENLDLIIMYVKFATSTGLKTGPNKG